MRGKKFDKLDASCRTAARREKFSFESKLVGLTFTDSNSIRRSEFSGVTCAWALEKSAPIPARVRTRLSFPLVTPLGPNLSKSGRSGAVSRLKNSPFHGFC